MSQELSGYGIGNATQSLIEQGVVLAEEYFTKHDLDAEECFNAFVHNEETNNLSKHWVSAEVSANTVLVGSHHDNSAIFLEVINDNKEI